MARKAVAATLASVILFTALVVADSTMMAANDNLASSSHASRIEIRESLLGEYSAGSAAIRTLAQVQSYLISNPADCAGLPQYLSSISAESSVSGEDTGIAYASNAEASAASATALSQAPQADNLTVAAPFSGYLTGTFNLQAALTIKELGGGGSVSLERHELHLLHLPILPDAASSLCASVLGSLASNLSGSSCNASLSQERFDSVMPSLIEEAAARGFFLAAGWVLGAGCSVTYWIMLVELGVEGVTGSFEWTVRGSGSTA